MSYPPTPPNDPYRPEGEPAGTPGEQPGGEPAQAQPPVPDQAPPAAPGYPAYPGTPQQPGSPYSAPTGQPASGSAPYGGEQGGYTSYPPPAQPGYGAPGQAPYGASPYPAPAAPGGYGYFPRNDLGVWALVLGIASFVLSCGFLTGIPAIIVGTKAKRAVEAGEANNGGLAQAGVILGWVASALSVVAIIVFVVLLVIGVASAEFDPSYY
ncbi:DUF4190 domain-containing protein [Oerskovia sp. Sa1BUA8]|uniref:DUF4190 domain-containing protein n=1 Tax=Oerskovia douganii TaxID=2762210 RepID=A0A9D5UDJ0_9CELL|nr:DUF4190 domain-containing protein [Oerskovia douganii]MBE7702016.1 DUF4190 domain-containing protein [Oerskovia douganii]